MNSRKYSNISSAEQCPTNKDRQYEAVINFGFFEYCFLTWLVVVLSNLKLKGFLFTSFINPSNDLLCNQLTGFYMRATLAFNRLSFPLIRLLSKNECYISSWFRVRVILV